MKDDDIISYTNFIIFKPIIIMDKHLENLDKKLYDLVTDFENLKIALKRQRRIYIEEQKKRMDKLNINPIVYFDKSLNIIRLKKSMKMI